jgi:hypothetical protein
MRFKDWVFFALLVVLALGGVMMISFVMLKIAGHFV